MNQRDATVNTILSVVADKGINYELNGELTMGQVFKANPDIKEKVRTLLITGFLSRQIDMTQAAFDKYSKDEKEMKKYVGGLIDNWVRKAPEFNNDQTYKAKNPGSRSGSGDESIKEMKKLLEKTTDPEAVQAIEAAIAKRQEELKPKVEINVEAIPEHLRHLVK